MKLAEALILRADQKKRIEQVKQRLVRNAKVQEGQKPAEDPQSLIQELESIAREMVSLIQRINRTNITTSIKKGQSLADAIAERDMLTLKYSIYTALAQAATITQDVKTRSEIKYKGTVKVADIQERADRLAKARRELDTKIQEVNWLTDLVE